MKYVALIFITLYFIGFLSVGVMLLQEPKCETATPKARVDMRCQKALYYHRG